MRERVAVILAAGPGTRMKSNLPKVLHPLLGEPMIRYVVDLCERLPVTRTIVVVGHQADRVKEALAGRPVEFALQEEQLGTAHALLQVEGTLKGFDGDLLVLSGDVPLVREETLKRLLEEHAKGEAAATLLSADLPDPKGYGRIVRGKKGEFFRIVEEAEASAQELKIREVNMGIYAFAAKPLFPALKEVRPSAVKKERYLPGALDLLKRQGLAIHVVKVPDPEEAIGINSRVELAQAHRVLQRRILTRWMEEGVTILDPEATFIGPSVK
ncbi:MAG: NTP transferase domain-containing protein, partial [candidate division NC10 bacterium]|nr:NTP transferase domain-containing protein [candidate division NC10 bacterium]